MRNRVEVVTVVGKTLVLELGNIHDNTEALGKARQIELEDKHAAAVIVIAVINHILRTNELKSRVLLLDEAYALLSKLGTNWPH